MFITQKEKKILTEEFNNGNNIHSVFSEDLGMTSLKLFNDFTFHLTRFLRVRTL